MGPQLFDVFPLKDRINCVLEYCTTDLERIIADPSLTLTPADVKSFMQMLLKGLAHCHACWILHRVRFRPVECCSRVCARCLRRVAQRSRVRVSIDGPCAPWCCRGWKTGLEDEQPAGGRRRAAEDL